MRDYKGEIVISKNLHGELVAKFFEYGIHEVDLEIVKSRNNFVESLSGQIKWNGLFESEDGSRKFRVIRNGDATETKMHKTTFSVECEGAIEGYTEGGHWNGWAMPYFTKENADKVVEFFSSIHCPARYDEQRDAYIFIMNGGGDEHLNDPIPENYPDDAEEERDIFFGTDIVVDGETIHVYPIGNGCWTWDDDAEVDQ